MAYKLGNDYKLFIADVSGGTFSNVKGQGTISKSSKSDVIDTTTKDDYPYKTKAPGSRDSDLSLDLTPNLPDTTGFTRLETLANAAPPAPFLIQIRKAPFGTTDKIYEASVYCTDLSTDFAQDGKVTAKAAFVLAAAPTTDALA
jgi:hypothetical protein